jgi:hypothetical protein
MDGKSHRQGTAHSDDSDPDTRMKPETRPNDLNPKV